LKKKWTDERVTMLKSGKECVKQPPLILSQNESRNSVNYAQNNNINHNNNHSSSNNNNNSNDNNNNLIDNNAVSEKLDSAFSNSNDNNNNNNNNNNKSNSNDNNNAVLENLDAAIPTNSEKINNEVSNSIDDMRNTDDQLEKGDDGCPKANGKKGTGNNTGNKNKNGKGGDIVKKKREKVFSYVYLIWSESIDFVKFGRSHASACRFRGRYKTVS
jgi:hypothetical protein